jgi:hypothetical protein
LSATSFAGAAIRTAFVAVDVTDDGGVGGVDCDVGPLAVVSDLAVTLFDGGAWCSFFFCKAV